MSDVVRLERDGGLARLTLDAPPLNLFTDEMLRGIHAAIEALEAEPARALLFGAEGRVVSGGVDVNLFDGLTADEGAELWTRLLGTVHRLEALPFPTIFAAHGLTLTAAFELALGCDLIVAAEGAQFGLVEIVVGLTPAMGGTQRLAERAGPGRARELVMTGGLFEAERLERWNVVNRVWPDDEFAAKSERFARKLADGPTLANAATKRIVRAFLDDGGVHGADAVVPQAAGDLFASEDLRNAVQKFLAEGPGKATFKGR